MEPTYTHTQRAHDANVLQLRRDAFSIHTIWVWTTVANIIYSSFFFLFFLSLRSPETPLSRYTNIYMVFIERRRLGYVSYSKNHYLLCESRSSPSRSHSHSTRSQRSHLILLFCLCTRTVAHTMRCQENVCAKRATVRFSFYALTALRTEHGGTSASMYSMYIIHVVGLLLEGIAAHKAAVAST